jgi:hypothetical protein
MSAEQLLKEYAESTERNQLLYNERVIRGAFRIERISSPSKDYPNLWQIRYAIYDAKNSLLSAFNSLVIGE